MRKPNDLTGQRFTKLVAISISSTGGRTRWLCRCDCGKEPDVEASNLIRGQVKSCGCHRAEVSRALHTTHGQRDTPTYRSWANIKARTTNPKCKEYKWYGARGIFMCDEWLNSFEKFFGYIGSPPAANLTVDRIDNDKGYVPGNVRWATQKTQSNNKSNNLVIVAHGRSQTASEWSDETGILRSTISARIKNGWSGEEAVSRKPSPLPRANSGLGVEFHEPPRRGN